MAFKAGTTGNYRLIQIPNGRCNESLIRKSIQVDANHPQLTLVNFRQVAVGPGLQSDSCIYWFRRHRHS